MLRCLSDTARTLSPVVSPSRPRHIPWDSITTPHRGLRTGAMSDGSSLCGRLKPQTAGRRGCGLKLVDSSAQRDHTRFLVGMLTHLDFEPECGARDADHRRPADDGADLLDDQERLHRLQQDGRLGRRGRHRRRARWPPRGRLRLQLEWPLRADAVCCGSASSPACWRPTRASLLTDDGENLDPHRIWATLMTGEKPGGHGERSVAVGMIDMAVWDAVAKIEGKPLYRLLADRYRGGEVDERVWVYAAGGYYEPGKDLAALQDEMRGYLRPGLHDGQDEDRRRAARRGSAPDRGGAGGRRGRASTWRSTPTAASICETAHRLRRGAGAVRSALVRGGGRPARLRAAGRARRGLRPVRWRPARTSSRCRMRAT